MHQTAATVAAAVANADAAAAASREEAGEAAATERAELTAALGALSLECRYLEERREAEAEAAELSRTEMKRIADEERVGMMTRVDDLEREVGEKRVALDARTTGAEMARTQAEELRASIEDLERKGAAGEVAVARVREEAVELRRQMESGSQVLGWR